MQTIGDLFNILLFVTLVGGMFTILYLAMGRLVRFALPLWFGICTMAAYLLPLPAPGLYLIPPEAHSWIPQYDIACILWFGGILVFAGYDITKTVLAHRAVHSYPICGDERINAACRRCAESVRLKKVPCIRFGPLAEPACVAGAVHPVIILNEIMIKQLTDEALTTVLCHELTHIRRGHVVWGRIYDFVSILNWFNPLVWIAAKEFAVHCEVDCDRAALSCLKNEVSNTDYARTMLHLLELSAVQTGKRTCGMSALGFILAKRRIELIMRRPSKALNCLLSCVLALLLAVVILLSMRMSRGHFYPYPSRQALPEYSSSQ